MTRSSSPVRSLAVGLPLVALVVLLSGCSGAGVSPAQIRNASLEELSAGQMTTLQLLRGWLGVMYSQPAAPPGQADMQRQWIYDDEGHKIGLHYFGTDAYGHAKDVTAYLDGHGFGFWYTPEELSQRVEGEWSTTETTVVDNHPRMTQTAEHRYPGMTMSWKMVLVYPELDDDGNPTTGLATEERTGTLTLGDGRKLAFSFYRNAVNLDRLSLQLPEEGLSLTTEVPVEVPFNSDWRPLARSTATGQTTIRGRTLGYAFAGVREDWRSLSVEGADGLTGTFSLGESMGGSGRYERDGGLLGVMEWGGDLVGHLSLTGLEQQELTPSAAAAALSIDNWLNSIGQLAPSPAI